MQTSLNNARRETVPGVLDAVVIGAGFAGLFMLYKLAEIGLTALGYEAASDVGGTWFWNSYPGARCDIDSVEYSFSFSPEIEQEWTWSQRYAEQPEILAYIRFVADRLNLRRFIHFNTRVLKQTYDEHARHWTIETDRGPQVHARHSIMACGNLTTPYLPPFDGLQQFKGEWIHSSRWRGDVGLQGRRIAQIGTGSTGIQLAPQLAEKALHLYVFQRSANYSVPAAQFQTTGEFQAEYKARYREHRRKARESFYGVASVEMPQRAALELSDEELNHALEAAWQRGGSASFQALFTDTMINLEANEKIAKFVQSKVRQVVKDPVTAELLVPKSHPFNTKRLCVDTGYYETFNRNNVTLVDASSTPIVEISEIGVRTAKAHYPVDVIVFATGFDAMTGALREIDIRGRNGLKLSEKWADGPLTYLGLMVSGFPNMFVVAGPGSPSVKSNMVFSIEQHVEWIADCLDFMRMRRIASIEASEAAELDWVEHVNEVAKGTLYRLTRSWYSGANIPGKAEVFMPYIGGTLKYRRICEAVAAENYRGFVFGSDVFIPDSKATLVSVTESAAG